jgi:hypothetical protein
MRKRTKGGLVLLALALLIGDVSAEPVASSVERTLDDAERLAVAGDFTGAKAALAPALALAPGSVRARRLLAWALEGTGELERELEVRARLIADDPDRPAALFAYGRALQRSGDERAALRAYGRAVALAARPTAAMLGELERARLRLAPEVAARVTLASDERAVHVGARTGVALPFGRAHRVVLGARVDRARRASGDSAVVATIGARLALTAPRGELVAGAEVGARTLDGAARPAASGSLAGVLRASRYLQLAGGASWRAPWTDVPTAAAEGGLADTASITAFALPPGGRWVVSLAAEGRRLSLWGAGPEDGTSARQAQAIAGVDWVAWAAPARSLRGETLDAELVRPTYVADAWVLSARHGEGVADADAPFAARIALAERCRYDELSTLVRKVWAGRVGLEVAAGVGRDWARDSSWVRGGAQLLWSPSAATRLTLAIDFATEDAAGTVGSRRAMWTSFHVDL